MKQFEAFAANANDTPSSYFKFAQQLFQQGRFKAASWYYLESINSQVDVAPMQLKMNYVRAANCFFHLKDFVSAAKLQQTIADVRPDDSSVIANLGIYHCLSGKVNKAMACLEQVLEQNPTNDVALCWMAMMCGNQGDLQACRSFGHQYMELEAAGASTRSNIGNLEKITGNKVKITTSVPEFNPTTPERNVIAFSLWGDKQIYYEGARQNAIIARAVYPGWQCRFYCNDTVPATFREELARLGAQVAMMESHGKSAFDGLFWRFLTANDENVDRYLIRDCDSLVNFKERIAVDAWLASDKHFHLMRDHPAHCVLILAGLWGGVRGALPSLSPLLNDYLKKHKADRFNDQSFLIQYVWPYMKQSYLAHDSVYQFDHAKSYPKLVKHVPKDWNIGKNVFVSA